MRRQFFEQALDAVRQVPGVVDAAFTSQLPLSGDLDGYGVRFESAPEAGPNDPQSALRYAVTPQWFQRDAHPARSRTPARRERPPRARPRPSSSASRSRGTAFPDAGSRSASACAPVPRSARPTRPWDIVVGVVGDVKQTSLAPGAEDAFYVSMGQWWWVDNVQSLVVRSAGDPAALAPAVRRAIWSVDRNQPISRVATMDALVARSEAQRRFVLTVFEAFGLAALALAAIGVFGMMSGSVTERMRELGVRAALGASRGRLLVLVLRQGLALAAAGIAAGLVGAVVLSGALRTLLFGISNTDTATYVGAGALVLVVALVASAFPAWRAARVDPSVTLRA